jgi:uncharacterized coiled-coil DUF342 family protein
VTENDFHHSKKELATMNKQRRKQIQDLIPQVQDLQNIAGDLAMQIEAIQEEEQEVFDNMPEAFQNAERGEQTQAAADALGEAVSTLQDLNFDDVINNLETACE